MRLLSLGRRRWLLLLAKEVAGLGVRLWRLSWGGNWYGIVARGWVAAHGTCRSKMNPSIVRDWELHKNSSSTPGLQMWRQTISCRVKGDMDATRKVLTPSFRKSQSSPQKTNRSARRCIWRYWFQAWVWNCQILNKVVETQLVPPLWNRYLQWLSDNELIQISSSFKFLFQE